jgi:hypothetical protein
MVKVSQNWVRWTSPSALRPSSLALSRCDRLRFAPFNLPVAEEEVAVATLASPDGRRQTNAVFCKVDSPAGPDFAQKIELNGLLATARTHHSRAPFKALLAG